jgi:hypothetical protein
MIIWHPLHINAAVVREDDGVHVATLPGVPGLEAEAKSANEAVRLLSQIVISILQDDAE